MLNEFFGVPSLQFFAHTDHFRRAKPHCRTIWIFAHFS